MTPRAPVLSVGLVAVLLASLTPAAVLAQVEKAARADPKDPKLAKIIDLGIRSAALIKLDRLADATSVWEEKLALEREVYGTNHANVAQSLAVLADLFERQAEFAAAVNVREEVAAMQAKLLGERHWQATDARLALAHTQRLARLDKDQRQRLRDIDKQKTVAAALMAKEAYREALPLARQILADEEKLLGEEDVETITNLRYLGLLHALLGEFAQSRSYQERAVKLLEKVRGAEHPQTATSMEQLATVLVRAGEPKAARTYAERALAIRRKLPEPDRLVIAESCRQLGGVLRDLGEAREARKLFEEALAVYRKAQRPDKSDDQLLAATADVVSDLGVLLQQMEDCAAARPLLEEALSLRRKTLGDEHADTALSLVHLGNLFREMEQYGPACKYFEQALPVLKATRGLEHHQTVACLHNLGLTLLLQGEHQAARPLMEQALALHHKLRGPADPDTIRSLSNLCGLCRQMGEHEAAQRYLKQAHGIAQDLNKSEQPNAVRGLRSLAALFGDQGEPAEARRCLERALGIAKKVFAPKDNQTAACLNDLGLLNLEMGDFAAARPCLEEALAIRRATLGAEDAETATSLNNMGVLCKQMGDFATARTYFEQCLLLAEKRYGTEHTQTALSLYNLGSLLHSMDALPAAKQCFERALTIRMRVLGPDVPATATTLSALGYVLQDQGEYAAARRNLERALEINKKTRGKEHPDTARTLNNLGTLLSLIGDYHGAQDCLEQSLAIKRKVHGTEHNSTMDTLSNLAACHAFQGHQAEAETLSLQALLLARKNLELASSAQSDRQQLAMARGLRAALDGYLSLASSSEGAREEAYRQVLAWKGAVLARQRRLHLERAHPELAEDVATLRNNAVQLAALALAGPAPQQREHWEKAVSELSQERERLESALAKRSEAYRQQQKQTAASPADVRAALPAGAVLVDFLEFTHFRPPQSGEKGFQREVRLLAFVVRSDCPEVMRCDLGPRQPIEAAVNQWRATVGADRGVTTGTLDEAAAELRRLVWQPLAPAVAGAKVVLVSPDGPLARFPLGALPGQQPGTYLLEELTIAVVPVPLLLLSPGEKPSAGASRKGEDAMLLVGDVDFAADPGTTPFASARDSAPSPQTLGATLRREFGALPGTRAELTAVAASFRLAHSDAALHELRGATATKTAFRTQASKQRYLHLATHGFFAPAELQSALDESATRSGGVVDMGTVRGDRFGGYYSVVGYPPSLLCGLALAGANRNPGAAQPAEPAEDGILTGLEVSEMDLSPVELVVLSACETGLGRAAGGEGLLGLQRSFQVSGARTVVASLWKVPDRETQLLMARYYANLWQKKMGPVQAMRQAQLSLLRATSADGPLRGFEAVNVEEGQKVRLHPKLWAAWTVSGDPGDLSWVEPVSVEGEEVKVEAPTVAAPRGVPPWLWVVAGVAVGVALAVVGRTVVRRVRPGH